jgi:hypothetical protein
MIRTIIVMMIICLINHSCGINRTGSNINLSLGDPSELKSSNISAKTKFHIDPKYSTGTFEICRDNSSIAYSAIAVYLDSIKICSIQKKSNADVHVVPGKHFVVLKMNKFGYEPTYFIDSVTIPDNDTSGIIISAVNSESYQFCGYTAINKTQLNANKKQNQYRKIKSMYSDHNKRINFLEYNFLLSEFHSGKYLIRGNKKEKQEKEWFNLGPLGPRYIPPILH